METGKAFVVAGEHLINGGGGTGIIRGLENVLKSNNLGSWKI